MICIILEFLGGGLLLCVVVWLKIRDVRIVITKHCPRLNAYTNTLTHISITLVAAAVILDPLIPGLASLSVRVPTSSAAWPTLQEHLRVRAIPFGLRGPAGGERIEDMPFGRDGVAQVYCRLGLLETRVILELYDQTQPSTLLESATIYVSPFVRRQIFSKSFTFPGKEYTR